MHIWKSLDMIRIPEPKIPINLGEIASLGENMGDFQRRKGLLC